MKTPFEVEASAPGKILLLGGYSVLERPDVGYVITVDSRVHVKLGYLENHAVRVSAPQFGLYGQGKVDPKTGNLDFKFPKEMMVLKTAIEIPIKYLIGIGADIPGFYIEARNDDGFASGDVQKNGVPKKVSKSGLGSSAAVTVAGIAAALSVSEHGSAVMKTDKDIVHKLAQLSHSVATGKIGSGFDIAAATYGSLIYTRYSPSVVTSVPPDFTCDDIVKMTRENWDYKMEPFTLPDMFKLTFANFLNDAAITTSLVSKINEFKATHREKYTEMIEEINEFNVVAISALKDLKKSTNGMASNTLERFREAFEAGRNVTRKLGELAGAGIEPPECSDLINKSEKHGAFVAKLPGAGGRDAMVALSTDDKSTKELRKYLSTIEILKLLDINIQNQGVTVHSYPKGTS